MSKKKSVEASTNPKARRQSLGRVIRQRRKAIRMTQADLGEAVGLGGGSISKIERGDQSIDLDTTSAIAKVFRVSALRLQFEAIRHQGILDSEDPLVVDSISELLSVLDEHS